ncbi:hypothetical protein E8E11_009015 [Didymella keratinophila]|nr:hypothetical protein E8E11_009015 [Didymella keratinophila]
MAGQAAHLGVTYGEDTLGELLPLLTDFIESCNERARPEVLDALYRYLDAQSVLLPEQNRSRHRLLPPPGSQDLPSPLPPDHTRPQATRPSSAASKAQLDTAAQTVMTDLSVERLHADLHLRMSASPPDNRERELRFDEKNTDGTAFNWLDHLSRALSLIEFSEEEYQLKSDDSFTRHVAFKSTYDT